MFLTPGYDACRRHFGRDFLAFYAAGTLARDGRTQDLYDLDTIRHLEQQTAASAGIDLGEAVGPWWNPPVYAWAFAPLSALSFNHALVIWTAINLAAACAAAWLLGRIAAPAGGPERALLALLLLSSAPFLQSITHGQNSAISLLIVAAAVTAWRSGANFAAGICVGLLGYKPQLAAALGVVLVLHRGRRAFGGLALAGAVVLLLTVTTMPGALADYFRRLPQNLHAIQVESTYLWERHVTLKGFWRLLLQGRAAGETLPLVHALTILSAAPLLAGLAFAPFRARSADAVIAATLAAAPLLMPFYFDYDLLLLAAAGALAPTPRRGALALWSTLYLWLFINPYLAGTMRLSLTVPLLYGLTASLLLAALRRETIETFDPLPLAQPALAKAA